MCVALPAALQNLQKKYNDDLLEHLSDAFYCFLLIVDHFLYLFVGFRVSKQGACVLRCLRRFRTLRKDTSIEFWSMYPMCFIDLC